MHRICIPLGFLFGVIATPVVFEDRKVRPTYASVELVSLNSQPFNECRFQEIELPEIPGQSPSRIELRSLEGGEQIQILPETEGALLKYLKEKPPNEPFSCISFVQNLLEIQSDLIEGLKTKGWHWEEFVTDSSIHPGSIVMLFSQDDLHHLRHIALKVADGLYLSKAGEYAPYLLLASIEAMKFLWDAQRLLVISKV